MKKTILSTVFIFAVSIGFGQEISKNALGFRLGSNNGFGAEVSYQKKITDNNRVEVDLGLNNSGNFKAFSLTGLYQWVWEIDNGFNWYAGPGAGVGSWSYNGPENIAQKTSGSIFYLAGDIGIEYNFDIPLLLSIDFRPELYLASSGYNNNFGNSIALSARYKF